ncbi:sugar ABC transporter permease [Actinomycetaceae bacterium WB03_NA08]|uniref:Sugar ABC transporter permease n=1 Tax=Scrofimicrobium canadense TaxID=2652290 RepID=A0A6N7VTI4_9ACTO|nr:sugar ABC transporter permease [Scrofimicrobium canadense]MSS85084.1 sugar ABC transporter permease [Scrofimicrobium canadense]
MTAVRANEASGREGGELRPLKRVRHRHIGASIALLALPLLVYGLFLLYPLGRVVVLSFYEWDGMGDGVWAGIDNYLTIFSDPRLSSSFIHALVLIFFYAVVPIFIGLILASLLVQAKVKGLGFFRTVVFMPQVIAMVVLAISWRQIYAPNGLINTVLRSVGLDGLTRAWLGDFGTALPAVGLIGTWVSTGLVTVLFMSGISRIPQEYYEAARLDGAGVVRQFWSITIPSVRGEMLVAATLTIIAALKTFDLIYMTTSGGPGTATTVPAYEVYNQAIRLGNVGVGSSLAVVLTVIIFVINVTVNWLGERDR